MTGSRYYNGNEPPNSERGRNVVFTNINESRSILPIVERSIHEQINQSFSSYLSKEYSTKEDIHQGAFPVPLKIVKHEENSNSNDDVKDDVNKVIENTDEENEKRRNMFPWMKSQFGVYFILVYIYICTVCVFHFIMSFLLLSESILNVCVIVIFSIGYLIWP